MIREVTIYGFKNTYEELPYKRFLYDIELLSFLTNGYNLFIRLLVGRILFDS